MLCDRIGEAALVSLAEELRHGTPGADTVRAHTVEAPPGVPAVPGAVGRQRGVRGDRIVRGPVAAGAARGRRRRSSSTPAGGSRARSTARRIAGSGRGRGGVPGDGAERGARPPVDGRRPGHGAVPGGRGGGRRSSVSRRGGRRACWMCRWQGCWRGIRGASPRMWARGERGRGRRSWLARSAAVVLDGLVAQVPAPAWPGAPGDRFHGGGGVR